MLFAVATAITLAQFIPYTECQPGSPFRNLAALSSDSWCFMFYGNNDDYLFALYPVLQPLVVLS